MSNFNQQQPQARTSKINSGALFVNQKMTSQKSPAFTGSINVDGVDYYLSAWNETSKAGQQYQSVKVTRKDQVQGNQPIQQAPHQYNQAPPAQHAPQPQYNQAPPAQHAPQQQYQPAPQGQPAPAPYDHAFDQSIPYE